MDERGHKLVATGAFAGTMLFALTTRAQEPPADDPAAEPPAPGRIEAQPPPPEKPPLRTPWEQWAEFKDQLHEETGTAISLNLDFVARPTLSGPEDVEEFAARYDLLIRQHFGDDSFISLDTRGGWGDALREDIGFFANTNDYAGIHEDIFILHLYYAQELFDDQLTVRVGKLDVGDWIDTNRYAFFNFIGFTLAHNSSIAFTGNTLGAVATIQPDATDWFYASAGVSNASQTPTETGLRSTFEGDADWLTIAEVGFSPEFYGREGIYRFIAWYNDREFVNAAGDTEDSATGFAISFDQDISDRLGLFLRFGVTDGDPFEPRRYYSAGFLINEPFPGRVDDSFAVGVVVNEFTDGRAAAVENAADTETYLEAYYNIQLTEWAQLQPIFQIVDNPGGTDRETVIAAGAHLALRF